MGRTVALEGRTLDWARGVFARYYAARRVPAPERFARREFAAFPFRTETLMRRHASFRSAEELSEFLAREVPRHVYYSSAYYRSPDHPKMAEKGWLGADLIFDLDADHLRGADALGYAGQLDLVKERVGALIDDFLVRDFGVAPENLRLVFSGGRGYHVHVRDEAFQRLTSAERREIVEYVMGVGFDPATAVDERREDGATPVALDAEPGEAPGPPKGRSVRSFKRLYPPDAPGWKGRMTRSVLRLLARWETEGAAVAAAEMQSAGLTAATARRLARVLIDEGKAQSIRTSLSLEVFRGGVPDEFLRVVLGQAAIEVQGETDAPVTTDIHRLIRLPDSLHGGTGLRVVPLDRVELERFEPLRDAVLAAPAGEEVDVELVEPVDLTVGGSVVRGAVGDVRRLATSPAVFLVLRGQAALRP